MEVTDLAMRLGEINEHWNVVGVVSFCVVPNIETERLMAVLFDEHITAGTCTQHSLLFMHGMNKEKLVIGNIVSTSGINFLETFISEVTCYVSTGTYVDSY